MTNSKQDKTPKSLYEKAVAYVLTMPKTEQQVRQWYARKTKDQNLIDTDIARLIDYNLINDADYAQAYVQCKKDKMGVKMMQTKLRQNGVSAALIEQALSVVDDQRELVKSYSEKYLRTRERTPETKATLFRWLLGKGFTYDVCQEVIYECWH